MHNAVGATFLVSINKMLARWGLSSTLGSRPLAWWELVAIVLLVALVDIISTSTFCADDGSSPCCCWANDERAATLLRLYEEFPQSASENSDWTLKWTRKNNNAWCSTIYHLERILNNHHRIVVRNYGSMFDSSYQDLAVSVSSDNALSSYDENLLKSIVFNACFSKFWVSLFLIWNFFCKI